MTKKPMILIALLSLPVPLAAQDSSFERKAEGVLRQPLQDTGLLKEEAAAVLKAAKKAPYSLAGMRSCANLSAAVRELDAVLGPDVDATDAKGEPLPGRLAEAGAKSAMGMLIPFRGLVREITGAAGTSREIAAMVQAGTARRGFLKGVGKQRGCRI